MRKRWGGGRNIKRGRDEHSAEARVHSDETNLDILEVGRTKKKEAKDLAETMSILQTKSSNGTAQTGCQGMWGDVQAARNST